MNKNLDISIIIVNFKNVDLSIDCINSIINFTSEITYEIIVVNNQIEQIFSNKLKGEFEEKINLKVINNLENIGFAAANNQGIDIANGKYILILNNDTIFIENTLKKVVEYIEGQDQDLIIGCKLLNADRSYQISIGKFDSLWYLFTTNFFIYKLFPKSKFINKYFLNFSEIKEPIETDIVKGAFIFLSSENMKKLNGFDEFFYFYGEETDLCYRFKQKGGKVIFFPETEIIHLGGATTDEMPWFKYKNQASSKIKTYKRQFSAPKYIIALFIHYCGLFVRIPIYLAGGILFQKKYLIKKSYFYLKQVFIIK